jgi:Peptidase family M28
MKIILFACLVLSTNLWSQSDTLLIKNHLTSITKTNKPRNHENLDQLNETADYIYDEFSKYSDSVTFQKIKNGVFKNVICSFGPMDAKRIIVGAHYDVCGNQEGADDNASGVVALLELARLLNGKTLNYRIDLVAYSLEEPPFFRSTMMGSYEHAKYLKDNNIDVFGMIAVEMIGYFDDAKGSQDYPIGALSLFYGKRGNYITLVKKLRGGRFVRKMVRKYKRTDAIRTKKFSAPKSLPGIDFSDHLNYWAMGFNAMMITDTAFYRNKNYHEKTDTMETLDLNRMAKVIDGLFASLLQLK